jgi:hypothetical protein
MTHEHEVPVPPPDRGLPDHRRRREELLMRIDPEDRHVSLGRRWGLPLGVATGVAALGVTAVAVLSGGATKNTATTEIGPGASAPSPTPTVPVPGALAGIPGAKVLASGAACEAMLRNQSLVPSGYALAMGSDGAKSVDGANWTCVGVPKSGQPAQIDPTAPVIATGGGQQLAAGRVGRILASCLGSDAPKYHAVIAVGTAIATRNEDGYVVAKNDAGKFAVCSALGDVGRQADGDGKDVNLKPTVADGAVQVLDEGTDFATPGTDGGTPTSYLVINSGHVSSKVAKVTISYGTESQQYPAIVRDGAYFLSVSTPYEADYSHPPIGWVHAFDASGHEIYNQSTDPQENGSMKK